MIALGGTQAVCNAALEEAAQGRATARIAGADRQETAALIARRAFPGGSDRVYVTRGAIGPDAPALHRRDQRPGFDPERHPGSRP